jgi:subtilisin-like proprotein convertase family protein
MNNKLFGYFYGKTVFLTALSLLLQAFYVSGLNGQTKISGKNSNQSAAVFTNSEPITIPSQGLAIPYPSTINVSGLTGTISGVPGSVRVTINQLNHTYPADLGMVLVGPTGAALLLQDRVTNGEDAVNVTYTISDSGATRLPEDSGIAPGTYKPTAYFLHSFPAPGPGTNYANPGPAGGGTATFASVFGGTNPNGNWNLFVVDFSSGDSGSINGGWSLEIDVTPPPQAPFDFDGDFRTDLSVFRPSDRTWYINRSSAGFIAVTFGLVTDVIVPQDYDGDGKTDIAVYRVGEWYILRSSDNTVQFVAWGEPGDSPVFGDFDGDDKADPAVFKFSNGEWHILKSSDGEPKIVRFGQQGDLPVPADYDGDDITDVAVNRNGEWFLLQSKDGFKAVTFGLNILADIPVPADYDGDGKDDIAVFRRNGGFWYSLNSSNGQFTAVQFGQNGDVPVPGNYDADQRMDRAVYRNGIWYLLQSTAGFSAAAFGTSSDAPLPSCPCAFATIF